MAGHEQGTEGDSFFVIFRGAVEAVAAAADAQRAMAAEPWPDGLAVRVRMGLHTGDIEATGGADVIGYAINRTARIAAVAHGGQVLLSDTTRGLVEGSLPEGIGLRDLGQHRLKDLAAPEHLAQLVIDELSDDFPPPRSLDAQPNNLPTQLTTFVGRDKELGEARGAAGRHPAAEPDRARRDRQDPALPPGRGGRGRRVPRRDLVRGRSNRSATRRWWPPRSGGSSAWRTAATARPSTPSPTTSGSGGCCWSSTISSRSIAAGSDVADLLRRCPNLACLVTTRIALRVSGEQEYPVPGLPAPPDTSRLSEVDRLNLPRAIREFDLDTLNQFEAVRLFIARASAVKPGFAVTNANAPAVAGISARLHGMPLAIELAAARIKLLTPDQILARLEHHLTLLTAGSRDLPERQQTLRGAIAWSYDLLDEGAKLLVDRLSVFRGGCELEMAETVCGPAGRAGRRRLRWPGRPRRPEPRADRRDGDRRATVRDARHDPRVRRRDAGQAR